MKKTIKLTCILLGAIGTSIAQNTSYSLNTIPIGGTENTGFGYQTLLSTTGLYNVANGFTALKNNTTGMGNTANGHTALFTNTTGRNNTANGYQSLYFNSTANFNTATGAFSLLNNNGIRNTATGHVALYTNTTGNNNTASGSEALYYNNVGVYNSAHGVLALYKNEGGSYNSAEGASALYSNTSGIYNSASGSGALYSNTTGQNNSGLGQLANVSVGNLSNATVIGSGAIVNASNKVRIGNSAVTVVEGPVAYTVSDGRFKNNISEKDVKGIEFIKLLRPVVYNFDTKKLQEFLTKNMPDSIRKKYLEGDFGPSTAIRQSGFIAQEVEKAAKEINYNFNGVHVPENENDNYSISYSQFVVPLVKGMQEQQQMIEAQQTQINELKALIKNSADNISETSRVIGAVTLNNAQAIVLEQNVPNPFAEQTSIAYTLTDGVQKAQILFYNSEGKLINSSELKATAGKGQLNVFASDLSNGIYSYTLVVDGKIVETKRMIKNK